VPKALAVVASVMITTTFGDAAANSKRFLRKVGMAVPIRRVSGSPEETS
jgi:hypothetical protein